MDPGTTVRLRGNPRRSGIVTRRTREWGGRIRRQVRFDDGSSAFHLDAELEAVLESPDPIDLLSAGKFGALQDLRGHITSAKLHGGLRDVLYSMETTDTDFYAYQYKPVLNFLDSPGDGILIADEVGLGKTIEAGLIWTELRARFDAHRLMVLCPAMLRHKWQSELSDRFFVDATFVGPRDLLNALPRLRAHERRRSFALIGSMQGLRPPSQTRGAANPDLPTARLAEALENAAADAPLFDLLIVDEAHYMRNRHTATAQLGRLLRDVAQHVVLLSATPIHLNSTNLYQLLNLVDPYTFNEPMVFDEILRANAPLLKARDAVLAGATSAPVSAALTEASRHPFLKSSRLLADLQKRVAAADLPPSEPLTSAQRSVLAHDIERVNLLGRVVNRTRKRDVHRNVAIRRAKAQRVSMHEVESRFYERITGLVREYAKDKGLTDGFLVVIPQLQMSSSMPAALRAWQEPGSAVLDEEPDEVHGVVTDLTDKRDAYPLREYIRARVSELDDFGELRARDTKYAELRDELTKRFATSPQDKILIFAQFKATLRYLSERLAEDGVSSLVLTGDTLDRLEVIRRYAARDGPHVLLASEVASEGIDLQFGHILVNYDLPWNPMKVEQRIGRLDRIGQKAPSIAIWNFLHEGTIDERIYDRLLKRIGIFESALGGLEPILGDRLRKMTTELLRPDLTDKEMDEKIGRMEMAIANYREHSERLEHEADKLLAHTDRVVAEIAVAHDTGLWVTAEDLRTYVSSLLARYRGSQMRRLLKGPRTGRVPAGRANDVFEITLASELRMAFQAYLRQQPTAVRTRLTSHGPVQCVFRPERRRGVRSRRGGLEFITQFHPLVRFAHYEISKTGDAHFPTVAVEIANEDASTWESGLYVFVSGLWTFEGIRTVRRVVHTAARLATGNQQGWEDVDAEGAQELVVQALRSGTDWLGVRSVISSELTRLKECAVACIERQHMDYDEENRARQAENSDRVDFRIGVVQQHFARQVEKKRRVLARLKAEGKHRILRAVEGQVAKLVMAQEDKLRELDSGRQVSGTAQELCMGVVRIR